MKLLSTTPSSLAPLLRKNGVTVSLGNGAESELARHVAEGTVVLTLGAGDVWKMGEKLFKI